MMAQLTCIGLPFKSVGVNRDSLAAFMEGSMSSGEGFPHTGVAFTPLPFSSILTAIKTLPPNVLTAPRGKDGTASFVALPFMTVAYSPGSSAQLSSKPYNQHCARLRKAFVTSSGSIGELVFVASP